MFLRGRIGEERMEERKLQINQSSNLTVLLQNQRMYSGAHFPVFQGRATNAFEIRRPLFELDDDSDDSSLRRRRESKRRMTTDQVRLLEDSFELDDKLDPQRKARLAGALGLQPRQIAIWFQNRRARWKTKRLEKDYEALSSIYENLKVDRECLIKEKEQLEAEVLSLTKKLLLKEKTTMIGSANYSTILDSKSSTPDLVEEEGTYNSMLMEQLAGPSMNAFGLDGDDNSDRSQIGDDDYAQLLW